MHQTLTPDHYRSIGEIVVVWAKLEAHLFQALRKMTRLTMQEALLVYWQMGYRERATVLQGLVYAKYPDKNHKQHQCFDTLVRRLETAYVMRNVAAHSIWFAGLTADEMSPFDFDARGAKPKVSGRGPKRLSYSAEALHKEALKTDRLAEDFKDFFASHFAVKFIHKKNESLE